MFSLEAICRLCVRERLQKSTLHDRVIIGGFTRNHSNRWIETGVFRRRTREHTSSYIIITVLLVCSLRGERDTSSPGDPAERREADEADRIQHHSHVQTGGSRPDPRRPHGMVGSAESSNRVPPVSRLRRLCCL